MQIKRFTFWTALLLSAAMLWGCGSNGSGGSDVVPTPTPDTVEAVGTDNCEVCHDNIFKEWEGGTHGNSSDFPTTAYFGHDPASDCSVCHDPDGESVDFRRPVIGCESCHGGGSAHRGIGPIPYARPDWQQCTACHDHAEDVPHADDHGMLASNVGASAHNNADNLHASTTLCQRCHSAEGAAKLAQYTGDADVMHLMDDLDPIDEEENLHPVTCSACHVPHDDSGRWEEVIVNNNDLASGDWDPNGNGVPDEFDFCTSCHTYYNQDGVLIGSGSDASGTAPFYHNTAWYRTLTTTHYDNPNTLSGQGSEDLDANPPIINKIEGYVIRENSDNPCFDCHGHELRTNTANSQEDSDPNDPDQGSTIHTQWASSGHAGRLLPQVIAAAEAVECDPNDPETSHGRCPDMVDAAMNAYVSDSTGAAWTHYDWDAMAGGRSGTGNQECQHCHTASGAVNFLDSAVEGVVYNPATNDFSHIEGWSQTVTATAQNEVLYCWGCHTNAQTGMMRGTYEDEDHNIVAVPIPLDYTVDGVETALTAPDVVSGVCLSCHSGRGNVNTLLDTSPSTTTDTDTTTFNPAATTGYNAGGTSTHYLTAGAIINQAQTKIGYTYGLDYTDSRPFLEHGHIGLGCAECHMTSEESHSFEVVAKDESGAITAIKSSKCSDCHAGDYALTAEIMEAEAEGYHEALAILADYLTEAGTPPQADYPYFSGAPVNEGHSGAMHNYSLLHHEPGAYAHNRVYAKRLIFDSIDWLDNDTMDGTITIDAATYPEAAHWFGADDAGVARRP
jgi:hypothetical protein